MSPVEIEITRVNLKDKIVKAFPEVKYRIDLSGSRQEINEAYERVLKFVGRQDRITFHYLRPKGDEETSLALGATTPSVVAGLKRAISRER